MTIELVEVIRLSSEDVQNIHAVRRLLGDIIDKSHNEEKRKDARAAMKALTKIYEECYSG